MQEITQKQRNDEIQEEEEKKNRSNINLNWREEKKEIRLKRKMVPLKKIGTENFYLGTMKNLEIGVWDKKGIPVLFCIGKGRWEEGESFLGLAPSSFRFIPTYSSDPPPKVKGKLSLSSLFFSVFLGTVVCFRCVSDGVGVQPRTRPRSSVRDFLVGLWLARAVSVARFEELWFGHRREEGGSGDKKTIVWFNVGSSQ